MDFYTHRGAKISYLRVTRKPWLLPFLGCAKLEVIVVLPLGFVGLYSALSLRSAGGNDKSQQHQG
jgi:hypothetical protein